MEKKFPPRLYAYKTIAGDWWATEKRQFGDHNIKADFEKLLPLMPVEEHQALIAPLIEALKRYETAGFDVNGQMFSVGSVAREALENYKKQTSEDND